jgi:hypothetical protein
MSGRPKHVKLKVDEYTGNSEVPTESEINQWTRRSRKGGVCGIVNCFNKPTKRCKKCTNCYCSEHFPSHLDLLPDCDTDYFSSNKGLDNFIDESESENDPFYNLLP